MTQSTSEYELIIFIIGIISVIIIFDIITKLPNIIKNIIYVYICVNILVILNELSKQNDIYREYILNRYVNEFILYTEQCLPDELLTFIRQNTCDGGYYRNSYINPLKIKSYIFNIF